MVRRLLCKLLLWVMDGMEFTITETEKPKTLGKPAAVYGGQLGHRRRSIGDRY
jgi:hypothetical protein